MKKIVLSNRLWFKRYLFIRNSILIIVSLAVGSLIIKDTSYQKTLEVFQIVGMSLLFSLMLFEYLQKPSLFEIESENGQLNFHFFAPDTRFLILFNEEKIKTLIAHSIDKVTFWHQEARYDFLDKLTITIKRKSGEVLRTQAINIAWMQREEMEKLANALERHNTTT
ncbi:MAG: hypothetical protein AAGG68_04200 [Bacteroidota bacterium]